MTLGNVNVCETAPVVVNGSPLALPESVGNRAPDLSWREASLYDAVVREAFGTAATYDENGYRWALRQDRRRRLLRGEL